MPAKRTKPTAISLAVIDERTHRLERDALLFQATVLRELRDLREHLDQRLDAILARLPPAP